MKYVIAFIASVITLSAFGQDMTYAEWQEEAKQNIRLLPEYGNTVKTAGQREADEDFIREQLKIDGTRQKASEHLVKIGFQYYSRGDIKTAMYRFNQAWLLDHANENAYWGYGAIYFQFRDFKKAIEMYNKGLKMNSKSAVLLTDKASATVSENYSTSTLSAALELLKKSYVIDPHNQNTTYKLSTVYYYLNDCSNARKYYDICKADGGDPIDEEYTKVLMLKCK